MASVDETVEVASTNSENGAEAGSPKGEPASDDALFDVDSPAEKTEEAKLAELKPEEHKDDSKDEKAEQPPKLDIEPPQDAEPGKPEPDTFTFHPKDGSPDITVASAKIAIPEGKQRWFFWKLRKLRGLEQPIFWLEQAGIPDHLQEQIMLLPDEEWARFYDEWMANVTGATPGE